MIAEILPEGRYNAISGQTVATILGFSSTRVVRKQAEIERMNGALICSCKDGYYKPVTQSEIRQYIAGITSHINSCRKSLKPAYDALKQFPGQTEIEME